MDCVALDRHGLPRGEGHVRSRPHELHGYHSHHHDDLNHHDHATRDHYYDVAAAYYLDHLDVIGTPALDTRALAR